MDTMQKGKPISSIRRLAAMVVISGSTLFTYGCATISIPQETEVVHHTSELSRAFSIGAISSCIEQNCRKVSFQDEPQELDPDNISVMNWNIYKGQRDNWMADFREFSRDQDIVIIQEAMMHSRLTESLKEQNFNWNLNTGFQYKDVATGVLTASRVKAVSKQGLRTSEPFLRLPKATLISRYDLRGSSEQLLVANIHSVNFTLGIAAYTKQIRKLQVALEQHDGPIILAGDFNSWSDERLRIIEEMISELSLQALSYENHNRTKIFGQEIDHVFYRGLEPVMLETREVTSSDHNPIMVTFRKPGIDVDMALQTEAAPAAALATP
ncbi:MAG TPA: endonuclease/exonuclease/phosphatase family protein [Gammaproteobacteria bacterium]|nr:endonuclease/exonuclease/phosphatase family protein [Gammaproteobacteria bacterium]